MVLAGEMIVGRAACRLLTTVGFSEQEFQGGGGWVGSPAAWGHRVFFAPPSVVYELQRFHCERKARDVRWGELEMACDHCTIAL